ncbi:MAG TPA: adenylate/guanylate cyclase domain-containing protein [Methylomirabilota bacterium]|nr:adenylate/guanylate cyclase domain-containing protein [Methylomirabilota bacterium]
MICPACATEIPAGFKFCGNCGQRLADAPAPAPAVPPAPRPEPAGALGGERREVAVLFADVSGFTRMSERLDPEDVHAVMNDCFAGLGAAISEEEGYVDKYIGDSVMALFGAPVAHEDDPARACRAALAMQVFLAGFAERCEARTGVPLRMRIGLHCGLVLAGGVGSDVRMDYSVMGDTVNLASRLESAAPPGGVLVSREVVRRTRGQFEFGPPRQLTVKGKAEPVEAYELVREVAEVDPRGRDGLSVALAGREAELAALTARWRAAAGREGASARWIEIRGEMGIGKTRLVEEATRRLTDVRLVAVVATPEARRRPFGLARRLVLAVVRDLTGDAAPPATRPAFAGALAPLGPALSPFLDALWHLAAPSRLGVPAPDPDPQTLRRMVERGVATLLRELATHAPDVAVGLDSYELADEASVELLESMGAEPTGWPMPVIVTARDEARPPHELSVVIQLGRLGDEAAGVLLDRLVGDVTLPAGLRRDILDRAAGVPLFIEEMMRSLVDQKILAQTGDGRWRWSAQAEPASVSLPASIRAAMVARLDRLPRAEADLLGQCAVQGVEFDPGVTELVRQAPARRGPPVAELLPGLRRRDLITDLGAGRWGFRQPLFQEACYETLLLRERRALHAETAAALCERGGGLDGVAPELLAHHFERAESWAEAALANLRAGDRAAELFVNPEAIRRYARALEMIGRLATPTEAEGRLAVLAHGGAARVHLRVGAYGLAEEHAQRMRSLAARAGDRAEGDRLVAAACLSTGRTAEAEGLLLGAVVLAREDDTAAGTRVQALYDLADLYHRADRAADALARLGEGRAAAGTEDDGSSIRADMLEGRIAHTQGRFADAAELYARAYEAAERVGSLSERARAANNLGNAARDLGDYPAARGYFEQALTIWERTGDTECIAGARNNLGNLAMSEGDFATAREHHEQSLAACRAIGNVHGAALAQGNLAILATEQGEGARAVVLAEGALDTLSGSGNVLLRGLVLVVLGEARLLTGDLPGARVAFDDVVAAHDEARHPLAVAGAWRGLGRLALSTGAAGEALALLDRALEAFEGLQRAQEAARTAVYRAEALWQAGDRERARVELGRAHERFAAMRAERDAERVERLLRDLTGS